jgi:chromosomal replication initiator protein
MNQNIIKESEIWDQCKEDLRKGYPVSLYNRFIEPLRFSLHEVSGESSVRLITPDAGSLRHIEKKYLKDITEKLVKYNIKGQVSLLTSAEIPGKASEFWLPLFHPHEENAHQIRTLLSSEYPDSLAFIWGHNGSGKTTLAKDLCSHAFSRNKSSLYLSYTGYLEEFSASLTSKKMVAWKNRLRSYDLLIIDDFQSVKPGSQKTQEELRFLINSSHTENKKIIILSDTHHSDLPLADILKSRIDSAYTVRLFMPDAEARRRILKDALDECGFPLSSEVTDKTALYLAHHIKESGWKLRSAVQRIYSLNQKYIHLLESDKERSGVLDSVCSELYTVTDVSPADLMYTVSRFYNVTEDAIRGPARDKKYVEARHVFSYICSRYLNMKLADIAVIIGRKDHTAVLHGVNKIEQKLKEDLFFQAQIRRITAESGLS